MVSLKCSLKNILIFGDSNSWGYVDEDNGKRYENRWPIIFKNKLNKESFICNIIEDALPGRTTNIDDDNDSCVLYPSKEFGDDPLQANSPLVFPPRGQLKFSEVGIEKIIAVCNFSDTAVRNELRATRPVSCYEEEQVLASKETQYQ